jgi:antitoxin component of MazEF toxin-antitoxin module
MVRVYRQNNKLAVYLSREVVEKLGLREDDEVDFFSLGGETFIFAKKSDIAKMLASGKEGNPSIKEAKDTIQKSRKEIMLSQEEINVLKKMDELRYNERTKENVNRRLNQDERRILQELEGKKVVNLFSKGNFELYSISNDIYNKFLMRKQQKQERALERVEKRERNEISNLISNIDDDNVRALEKDGFVVLGSESEASLLSTKLEESIRRGFVLGTRAFDKKYYIALRSFIEKNGPRLVAKMREGKTRIEDLSRDAGISEEGARAVLYFLAESGEVSEKKRDSFSLA